MDKTTENNVQVITKEIIDDNKSTVRTSLIASVITASLLLGLLAFLSQEPLANIRANSEAITRYQQQNEEIKESIRISRAELEQQVRAYIEQNYGALSERDEKVDKLMIFFKQQDARLSNIEKALSNF